MDGEPARDLPVLAVLQAYLELQRDLQSSRREWDAPAPLSGALIRAALGGKARSEVLNKVQSTAPEAAQLIRSHLGNPAFAERLRHLQEAWNWAAAAAWVRQVSDPGSAEKLESNRESLQRNIESKVAALASHRAWTAFFEQLDDRTLQALIGWTQLKKKIGKGKGKFAPKHQREAQKLLRQCLPKIPAWIMPIYQLWENTDPEPGVFDTIIVDEASQAGLDALVLLLLGKRIVVVGDDKQNSPEAVGIAENDLEKLKRQYLGDFGFSPVFRLDTSLYDHAYRAFQNLISLREHFRCVPEIIRFSNEHFYRDAPLIPLRQPPAKRLPPLRAQLVEGGHCEGSGQDLRNPPEAEALVRKIVECVNDQAYEGKTMGVVVLQGRAQAELIESLLAQRLTASVREDRKLRCGVPSTFQGDERDVIFLSMVVAPNHSFRALTSVADERRFNVAMSRARDQVWLFHSVGLQDLSREDLRYKVLRFVSDPAAAATDIVYEEMMRLEQEARDRPRALGSQPDPYESWFEVDVALELLRRGYRVRPQVQAAEYRIDLVVEGFMNRLAVECDGDAWHGPERYEQDLARQRQLERAGWHFVRIREAEFYLDRQTAVERIVAACGKLEIFPAGQEPPDWDKEGLEGEEEKQEEQVEKEREVEERSVSVTPASHVDGEQKEPPKARRPQPGQTPQAVQRSDSLGPFPDPRTAPAVAVRNALKQIIEAEGPLNKGLLFRLYVEGCPGLQRAGKNIRSALNRALYQLQRAGEILAEDELGDRSLESQVLRAAGAPRVRARSAEGRDLFEIPPSELFLALDAMTHGLGISSVSEEDFMHALLEHYGFQRLTESRRKYLKKLFGVYRGRRSAPS